MRPGPLFAGFRGWRPADLPADAAAGLTLAAIAIPEQMATARLGGLAPEAGFLAFICGSLAFAAFGASRHMSVGADSTITPIFAGGLVLLAASGSPQYGALAAVLALMVGVLVLGAGLLRLGWVADLLSVPVTAGFLAGISIHIAVSQLPDLLGLPAGSGDVFHRLAAVAAAIGSTNLPSLAIGLGVFAIVVGGERLSPRLPSALVALALAVALTALLDLPAHGVAVVGAASLSLSMPALPPLSFEDLRALVPMALLLAIVVMVQTAATTRSFRAAGSGDDVNRDFVGVGAGSVASGLLGVFPVNASPPRTAIVAATGGRSQVGGLLAAAIVLALALFGSRLLASVPQAALAGILLFVALRILRWNVLAGTWRQAPVEFLLILVTALAIVALPIEVGVALGIGLSLVHGVWSMSQTHLIEFMRVPGTSIWWPPADGLKGERLPGFLVLAFQAPLSFLNADPFRRGFIDMIDRADGTLQTVVFEASSVIDIDYTAAAALSDVIDACEKRGIGFAVARLESVRAQLALRRFGLADRIGHDRIFRSVDNATAALAPAAAARAGGETDA